MEGQRGLLVQKSFRSSLRTWCPDLEMFTRDGDCKYLWDFKTFVI